MSDIFGDLKYVKIYLDDILIHSENFNLHIEHLSEVLKRIKEKEISINVEKSNFAKK